MQRVKCSKVALLERYDTDGCIVISLQEKFQTAGPDDIVVDEPESDLSRGDSLMTMSSMIGTDVHDFDARDLSFHPQLTVGNVWDGPRHGKVTCANTNNTCNHKLTQ
eukprot:3493483-Amphidinium_carterae.1